MLPIDALRRIKQILEMDDETDDNKLVRIDEVLKIYLPEN